jgi:hypothetical protein
MDKLPIIIICVVCFILIFVPAKVSTSYKKKTEQNIETYVKTIDSLNNVIIDLRANIDTINTYYIEANDELVIAKYKLDRIEYYNNVAAKGNNIKFLRGWIKRVIDGDDK